MVKIDITNEEIQAFDIVLGKVEVKPIVGYKLANLRIKIQNALTAKQKPKIGNKNERKSDRKIKSSRKKRD